MRKSDWVAEFERETGRKLRYADNCMSSEVELSYLDGPIAEPTFLRFPRKTWGLYTESHLRAAIAAVGRKEGVQDGNPD